MSLRSLWWLKDYGNRSKDSDMTREIFRMYLTDPGYSYRLRSPWMTLTCSWASLSSFSIAPSKSLSNEFFFLHLLKNKLLELKNLFLIVIEEIVNTLKSVSIKLETTSIIGVTQLKIQANQVRKFLIVKLDMLIGLGFEKLGTHFSCQSIQGFSLLLDDFSPILDKISSSFNGFQFHSKLCRLKSTSFP